VATVIGDRVLEGIVDLLYRDDDGLVVVAYKTDAVPLSALHTCGLLPATARRLRGGGG
jgi:ATP-dependent exoDNAse (exonuclease V) beta subunit